VAAKSSEMGQVRVFWATVYMGHRQGANQSINHLDTATVNVCTAESSKAKASTANCVCEDVEYETR